MAAVSTTAAVGWLVSPIVRRMVSVVQSYMSSQYSWKSEMVPDLKRIEALLMEILLVVGAAERQQTMDRNQIVLLQKLKEAVCDAENILDKFEYMLLKEKIEQQDMVTCIASSSLSFGMRLIGLDKFRSKLQKVIETMTRVRACADMLVRVMTVERNNSILSLECVHSRATGSLLYEDVVFGRQKEIDELLNQLGNQFHECSLSDGQRFRTEVHTIVGVGGVGKTTLTQLIYNDERIADNFDLRMWVCVSNTFDKFRLIKDMIACTTVDQNIQLDNFSFSMLQKELERAVHGKRFLLVLDDVWYDEKYGEHINKERWMELLAPIKSTVYGNRRGLKRRTVGSKILVTTRTELVANMLDSRSLFLLDGLGHDDSWLLFRRCAFGNMNPEDYPDLKRTGIQIVQKLKGSALALKVIGGHLNGKYTESEWDNVLHKDLVNPNDILTILRLSYDSLPEHLQQCFAYCSLFPKAYRFDPNRLIRMWVAHGFVHLVGTNSSSLEDTGRRYFNDLLARSFFQVLQCGDHRYFIMHDSMNDLALHVSQGECFRADHDREIVLPHSVSHLSISAEQLGNIANSDNLRRLRTLIVLSKSWFCSKVCLNHDILKKLKGVRVLDLTGCCFETFPEAVNSLIHLRFVAIRRTHFPHHSALSRLYHLQALFVQYHSCYSSGITSSTKRKRIDYPRGKVNTIGGYFSLPESISKLRNLVHVNVEKAYTLMLSGMHPFPYVEGSGEFLVDKEEQSLVKLKDLNKISGELAIRLLEHIRNWEEAAKANLNQKEHITKLELEWGLCDGVSIENGFKVLDVLKPQCNLDELTITGYPGFRSPSWLESGYLRRLKFVCLRDCNRWEILPPLGDLPLLRTLEVRRMGELKTAGPEFFGCSGFPSLEKLLLERLPKLRWSVVENDQVFPNLRHLSVAGCPQLREYPTYPRTLRHIAILDKERIQVKTCIDSFDLSRSFCRLVSSSFHVLRAHHLEFVRNLEIYVNYLVSMSNMAFNNMRSLKKLKIYGIDRSKTFSVICTLWDENGHTVLPSSLRCLKLQRCYMQPYSFSKLLNNLSSLDTLHLTECDTVEMPCPPLNLSHLRMLKQLHIYKCDWITFFKCSEALVTLEEMKIDQCYDLEYIPDVNDMPSLQKLHLKHCPQVMRLSNVGYQTTLKELVIEFCDGLLSLGQLRGLVSLTELRVIRCSDLVLLPDMDAFYSLEILVIKYCPLLRSLPKSGLPVSLKTFVLDGCHQALEEQFQQKEGSDWNKVAALPGCMRRTNESTQKHGPSYSGMEWEMWDEF